MNNFRRKRFQLFFELLRVTDETTILDVGGLPYDCIDLGYQGRVVCVGLSSIRQGEWGQGNISYHRLDATSLPYPDEAFDVASSNSLLEHVGHRNHHSVANEIRRIAPRYWVQVPNRNFPIEPHYRALFFYQLPRRLRRIIATYWTPLIKKHNSYLAEVDTIHPLRYHEMQSLFPEATVVQERVLGFTKSLIALQQDS